MQMYLLCLQPSVRKELGVGDRLWEACDMQVHAGEPEWRVMLCAEDRQKWCILLQT